ncbi:hypothetical protein D1B31_13325 [Neobacillus notoginsengisoli]|uniref:LURP-one-related family protein n=1 Tax=Neobacillus notoginsengisoli TaxID=1578198 RepID=A0A417YSK2_9BACI|nr:hypothetical protein [Neobacillus notoginsengisoli]RHW38950.1 hypothetical protein D1B31_13325 [Neobacillus notoginsengisoli]
MEKQTLIVSDNFFSTGSTDIFNEAEEKVGVIDLKSMFTAELDVLNLDGKVIVNGRFPFLSRRWIVTDSEGREMGELRARFAFFSKRYEYSTSDGRIFEIESEAFSSLYLVYDENRNEAGRFEKISGFFSSAAFQLTSFDNGLDIYEFIAVVMGVNAIQKAERNTRHGAH